MYKDLCVVGEDMQIEVGMNIEGRIVDGCVIVQTPGYLKPGVWNLIDEFQFLTEHNKTFIETFDNYRGKTILSSATVDGPLMATFYACKLFDIFRP